MWNWIKILLMDFIIFRKGGFNIVELMEVIGEKSILCMNLLN